MNLALNKIPLEKELWRNIELATDGKYDEYDANYGYAAAKWPCTFTIDLETQSLIKNIRFLLWDNLGGQNTTNKKDRRKYKFSLSLSVDGINYTNIYSNQKEDGDNGWFEFVILNEQYARYVQLTGHSNTVNNEIHLVEFEIYSDNVQEIKKDNHHKFDLYVQELYNIEERIKLLVSKTINEQSNLLLENEEKNNKINEALEQSFKTLKQFDLIKNVGSYADEALKNKKNSNLFLVGAILTTLIFIVLLIYFIYFDNKAESMIENLSDNLNTYNFIEYFLINLYIGKALLLSTSLFILGWFFKNYRSEKHNYIVNKHKAMTLTVASEILINKDFQNINRDLIFLQASQIIFSHQNSGFIKDETNQNEMNPIIQKLINNMK